MNLVLRVQQVAQKLADMTGGGRIGLVKPIPTDNLKSPAALARFVLTTIVALGLDLWTKSLAVEYLENGRKIRFIPGWIDFEYTRNFGAVMGKLQGQRPVFVAVSILAILFLSYLFATSGKRPWYQFLLGLLLAGVLGNLYDRIVFRYVRDMIHAFPDTEIFPWIFNVADCCLCVGVGLMILYSLIYPADAEARVAESPASE